MTNINLELELPDDIARQLRQSWDNLPQRALEALAAEGYRSGALSAFQVQQMLRLSSRWETEAFLKAHHCYLEYDEENLARDVAAIRRVNPR